MSIDENLVLIQHVENQKEVIKELIKKNNELVAAIQVAKNQEQIINDLIDKNIRLSSRLQIAEHQIKHLESINNVKAKPAKRISAFKRERLESANKQ